MHTEPKSAQNSRPGEPEAGIKAKSLESETKVKQMRTGATQTGNICSCPKYSLVGGIVSASLGSMLNVWVLYKRTDVASLSAL